MVYKNQLIKSRAVSSREASRGEYVYLRPPGPSAILNFYYDALLSWFFTELPSFLSGICFLTNSKASAKN